MTSLPVYALPSLEIKGRTLPADAFAAAAAPRTVLTPTPALAALFPSFERRNADRLRSAVLNPSTSPLTIVLCSAADLRDVRHFHGIPSDPSASFASFASTFSDINRSRVCVHHSLAHLLRLPLGRAVLRWTRGTIFVAADALEIKDLARYCNLCVFLYEGAGRLADLLNPMVEGDGEPVAPVAPVAADGWRSWIVSKLLASYEMTGKPWDAARTVLRGLAIGTDGDDFVCAATVLAGLSEEAGPMGLRKVLTALGVSYERRYSPEFQASHQFVRGRLL